MDTQETAVQEQVRTVGKTQCSGCKRYFVGVSAFAAHQVSDLASRFGQRCLTDAELSARGFATEQRPVRMYRDGKPYTEDHPIWYSVAGRERLSHLWAKDEDGENALV